MFRALLTLWYTLTVLAGPALCCCSARVVTSVSSAIEAVAEAKKPTKSCCSQKGQEEKKKAPKPAKDHGPSECPCKHQPKQVADRPGPAASGGVEALGQSRLLDPVWADAISFSPLTTLLPTSASNVDPPGGLTRPVGRDLLAAFHILRC